jgi:hypothetical protein
VLVNELYESVRVYNRDQWSDLSSIIDAVSKILEVLLYNGWSINILVDKFLKLNGLQSYRSPGMTLSNLLTYKIQDYYRLVRTPNSLVSIQLLYDSGIISYGEKQVLGESLVIPELIDPTGIQFIGYRGLRDKCLIHTEKSVQPTTDELMKFINFDVGPNVDLLKYYNYILHVAYATLNTEVIPALYEKMKYLPQTSQSLGLTGFDTLNANSFKHGSRTPANTYIELSDRSIDDYNRFIVKLYSYFPKPTFFAYSSSTTTVFETLYVWVSIYDKSKLDGICHFPAILVALAGHVDLVKTALTEEERRNFPPFLLPLYGKFLTPK